MTAKRKTENAAKVLAVSVAVLLFFAGFAGGAYAFHISHIPAFSDPIVSGELEIHFPELGNKYTGDFTYIKAGDTDILIDGGSKVSSIPTLYEYVSTRATDGIIEYVIVTHAHEDHYAAYATGEKTNSLFDLLEVGVIIDFATVSPGREDTAMYKNYLRERAEEIAAGAVHYTAKELVDNNNTVFRIAPGVSFEILDSYYYHNASNNENNNSVCVLFSHGDRHFLFTGDLERDGERKLVELNDLPKVELLKAGHHGSATSTHEELLKAVRPENVVITCVAGSTEYTKNASGIFPTQSTIDRIAPYTDRVYITSLCIDFDGGRYASFNGTIVVKSTRTTVTVTGKNHSMPLKDTDWFRENRTMPESWAS